MTGPSEPRGCEPAVGRRHMDRHIVQNRIGYLLLRGEGKKEKKKGKWGEVRPMPQKEQRSQDGERRAGVARSGHGSFLKVTINHNRG